MPAGLCCERFGGGGGGGQHLGGKAMLPQPAQNVVFHPIIERHDRNVRRRQRLAEIPRVRLALPAHQVKRGALLVRLIPAERLFVRDFLDVIHAHEHEFLARA